LSRAGDDAGLHSPLRREGGAPLTPIHAAREQNLMSSILESFASQFGPDIVGKLGSALGADAGAVSKGLGAIGPLLLNGMSGMAGTPGGADNLLKALPQGGGGLLSSLLGNLFGGGGASAMTGGGGMLQSLLGPGINAVSASISRAVGFNVAPLLSMAAPAVMGVVSKMVQDKGLTAADIGPALAAQKQAFFDNPANAESAALVRSALAAGDKAAAQIQGYGADWSRVQSAPAAALMMVATADLSGPVGSIKEVQAASKAMAEVARRADPASLIGAAFGSGIDTDMLKQVRELAPSKDRLIDIVKAGAAAVATQDPGQIAAYKAAILSVAQATAEAAKDGGFLGIGGTLVSADEQAALDRLKAALA
jgi:Bacterial protein of unknown function (DUF937)